MKRHKLYHPREKRTPEEKAYIKRENVREILSAFFVIIFAIIMAAIAINILQAMGNAL